MSHKTSAQIRQEFFDFFAEKEHAIVDSAPVVPKNDPTLLFTNAGMNQFKSIFLGEEDALKHEGKNWNRAADTQKCIRVSGKHNDLEEVGHDTYHHTLFEMLGNWSFGDYFKKEAIGWAWELLVDEWGLEPDRLYATVFGGDEEDGLPVDEEAIELWKSETSIDHDHILKCGKKDNFWEMGETGPCGPCSEVHIDLRPDEDRKKKPGADLVNMDDPRVMEIWNLVFIQFNRKPDSSLEKLPAQHVDTGMGFERICAVLQNKTSNYDTDVFTPVINKIADLAGITYGKEEEKDIAMRVIADHIRAVTFSIADGASPGNDGRGYVIRRILRRAIRYGWDVLDFKEPFFYKLVEVLADQFEDVFPEITAQQEYIVNVIRSEEKSFLKTLGQGIELFNEMVEGKDKISGEDAFKLHDTYGFPIDLTELMAREQGVEVDVEGFNKNMKEQKERARAAGKFSVDQSEAYVWNVVTKEPSDGFKPNFVGYDDASIETRIIRYRKEGDKFALHLEKTPFYAESGGQVADTGTIFKGDEYLEVLNVQKGIDNFHIHYVDKLPEDLTGTWTARIDLDRRIEIQKHHSATHLVHAALRGILGDHVAQKGSLVDEHHLRFDFSHFEAMTDEQLEEVEQLVNEKVQENIPLTEERGVPIEEAKERGAMMLFGEKYGESVRVISFDEDYSVELCGGTHVGATGEIGYFRFTQETSVAAGIRRIEAVCGAQADKVLRDEKRLLQQVKASIGQTQDLAGDIVKLLEDKKSLEKELEQMQLQNTGAKLDELIQNSETLDAGINLVKGEVAGADMDVLKQLGYDGIEKTKENTAIVLGSRDEEEGKVYLMVALSDDLVKEKGLKAGAIVGQLGRLVGGGGGGQPNLATAGGRQPEKLGEALKKVNEIITESIS
ncbi:MAG: alanine--tRNA ligase [Balneola sp.]|nr:alanine--tRNA ligase [Balneola sp.]MBE78686.1 alanine--tRNA ligase [Balneola sp.]|tara:strand:+ start:2638 stop:5322 length:2685 start_codon:yes stop_codon:yes gene_type:complete